MALKRAFILFLFILSGSAFLNAQSLTIKGKLDKGGEAYKDAEVYLYERNEVIGKTKPNWVGKFTFELSLNSHYTVEVCAEDHVTKKVNFDTRIPDTIQDPSFSTFDFSVLMLEARRIPDERKGIFDYPVGRVYFDPYQEEFRFSTEYTAKIRREFRKALNMQRRMVERSE